MYTPELSKRMPDDRSPASEYFRARPTVLNCGTWFAPVRAVAVAALIGCALAPQAVAQSEPAKRTIAATSKITDVTVYRRSAEVVRTASVDLAAGDTRIAFPDLPQQLVPGSVRVSATGTGDLILGSVETKTITLTSDEGEVRAEQRRALETERDAITRQIERIAYDVQVKETQRDYLINLAGLPARGAPGGNGTTAATPDWSALFSLIGDRMSAVQADIFKFRQEQKRLNERIADIERELARLAPKPRIATRGSVLVTADAAMTANLKISYQVKGASWRPFYDARLTTPQQSEAEPTLELVRRARISQSTSEPWRNVVLTLSTARVDGRTSAPNLKTVSVDIRPKRTASSGLGGMLSMQAAPTADRENARSRRTRRARAQAPKQVARSQEARIAADAFQVRYIIDKRVTVENDSTAKAVLITRETLKPQLSVRTTPRRDPRAFLSAAVTLPAGTPFLAGQISLFRNATYVGRGRMPQRPGGQTLELGFGADNLVQVKVETRDAKRGATGIITSSNTDTRSYAFKITNRHAFPVRFAVVDQLPVSADDKITVDALSGTKPSRVDVDGERGVIAWDGTLAPDATATVQFGFRITWPEGEAIRYR